MNQYTIKGCIDSSDCTTWHNFIEIIEAATPEQAEALLFEKSEYKHASLAIDSVTQMSTRHMVRIVTDKTNLQQGWVYPMIRVDNSSLMLDVDGMGIFADVDDVREVTMPYQTVLRSAQPARIPR